MKQSGFKSVWFKVLCMMVLSLSLMACQVQPAPLGTTEVPTEAITEAVTEVATDSPKTGSIILSTTTSTENSGLLAYILPDFTAKTGLEVKVVAVGSGQALQMGVDGEADVLLVHAKADEIKFVENGDGLERFDVMYNDFILVGPESDPAGIKTKAPQDIIAAMKLISENGKDFTFVSRGDDSGTHKKELSYWKTAEVTPEGDWYISAGKGMGDVLTMADEKLGYTLTDRATFLSMEKDLDLKILVEGDKLMFNQYGVIAVNPTKNAQINAEGAQAFINWILSDETQQLIASFGVEEYGKPLFFSNPK
jgi:tungstate transport system substrate-binding protein